MTVALPRRCRFSRWLSHMILVSLGRRFLYREEMVYYRLFAP